MIAYIFSYTTHPNLVATWRLSQRPKIFYLGQDVLVQITFGYCAIFSTNDESHYLDVENEYPNFRGRGYPIGDVEFS